MRVPARGRRRWRALAFAVVPGALLVTATVQASPPDSSPPTTSWTATPLSPTTDSTVPPSTSPPPPAPSSTEPADDAPASTAPAATDPPTTDVGPGTAPTWTATPLSPADRLTSPKAPTSQLAETDPALLGRTDDAPVQVLIKLDYDSVATYGGTIDGLDATSPSVTGSELTTTSPAEVSYDGYIASQEQAFAAELAQAVPDATIGTSLRTVYGGVAATVPANRIADVVALPDVVAVQEDKILQLTTDSSRDFIGATTLYRSLGGNRNSGRGTLIGVLDSGVWPEHPSLADQGNLSAPPAKRDGTPRSCDFGDNPLTPATDVFACNDKLIGGQAFLTGYLSNPARAAAEPYKTARDSNGHGTHTGTTAAGNYVRQAPVLGVDRGPLGGIAPGAWVSAYKVCGIEGCVSSDSAAAVQQAILDGVDVINFSISGGTDPKTDPVELAFLDAYAAGVFVATSAGNDGPGASTANHLSPWTTTVAASTQVREFVSTLTLRGAGTAVATFTGASITAGVPAATPVVMSSAAPYSRVLCDAPAPAGLFAGKVVACQRGGNARVDKGFNVRQGGAVGMILYNPTLADIETDNHWLPTIHLADGRPFVAFMTANPGATATFTAGLAANGEADVMAAFSSRGPAGNFIKPDITAPGVQVLAGHTPTPESPLEGPPGQYYQAIAGTSMSSPHIAGAALLLAALHDEWTPGQIKSAMMTTAFQDVVKEDLVTPTDPFDDGAGRVDLTRAGNPGLTFDASADDMVALGLEPSTAVHLNLPSVNIPILPGRVQTTRTATNVGGKRMSYTVETTSPRGSTVAVTPRRINVAAGASAELGITVASTLGPNAGQQFGEIRLVPNDRRLPTLHLPVAFVPVQGEVTLEQACDPTAVTRGQTTTCTVTATNTGANDVEVDLQTYVNRNLTIVGAEGASVLNGSLAATLDRTLPGAEPGVPAIAPGASAAGYLPLGAFGVAPTAIGDEEIINYNVPEFVYAGVEHTRIGVDSNGYLVVGGGTSEDNVCCDPEIPAPSRPNNLLAPFWTDLDGTGAPGISATTLTDGVDTWLVVQWDVNVFGTTSHRTFQTWIGLNGTEDISYAYDPEHLPADPAGEPYAVGAENEIGQGAAIAGLPTTDLRVTSTAPTPGGTLSYEVTAEGGRAGIGVVTSEMSSPDLLGTTVVSDDITVSRR